ncbi:MAG: phosphohydrolase [Treponema sp.]|nr:MAG: phosphohydrolase [Treponema sp.]
MSYTKSSREKTLLNIITSESSLHTIQDVDILLEKILTDARKVVNADAGSIYVVAKDVLSIKYAQNDTLKGRLEPGEKMPYTYFSFPIDTKTIAGYVASKKELVNEPNVYDISPDKEYSFGKVTDKTLGYQTVSNLTMPLISTQGTVLGVIQVLNAKDKDNNIIPFTSDDEIYLKHFASNATVALEHAYLTRSMILRMIKMSEMRDPSETGTHIKRVANYAVETYDRWAFNNNIPQEEQSRYRDSLKIASMLHDVGKVAIPDSILKKPGRLTEEEFSKMQTHTWLGAQLFDPIDNEVDRLSCDIALRHHENWNGTGYPGNINLSTGEPIEINSETGKVQGLAGEEIPLGARIVAIADVYDALSCKRAYKEAWTEDKIIAEMKSLSGIKFDPELLKAFIEVLPRIQSIKEHFSSTPESKAL